MFCLLFSPKLGTHSVWMWTNLTWYILHEKFPFYMPLLRGGVNRHFVWLKKGKIKRWRERWKESACFCICVCVCICVWVCICSPLISSGATWTELKAVFSEALLFIKGRRPFDQISFGQSNKVKQIYIIQIYKITNIHKKNMQKKHKYTLHKYKFNVEKYTKIQIYKK